MDRKSRPAVDAFLRSSLSLSVLVVLLLATVGANAQTVTFTGAQSAITTFSSSISPIAVDSAGEIFTVESTGTGFRLVRVLPSGQKTVLNSNFPWSPTAIAVNPQGTSLYFIHAGPNWQMPNGGPMNWVYIAKTTISGDVAAPPTDLPCIFSFPGWTTAYSSPTDLKVDTAGNVYIADYGGGLFWKIGAGSTVPTQFLTLASSPGQPWGLALTPDGSTVYFTYSDMALNPRIGSVPASFFGTSFTGRTPTVVATGLTTMQSGLVVDGSGVLYVGGTIPSGESVVFRVSGGVLTPVTPPSPSSLYSFGVDGAGKFYTGGVDTAGHPVISTTSFTGVGIGSTNIGASSAILPLDFYFNTGGTLGSIELLTEGASNLDFKNVGTGTCNTTTAFSAGATCRVNVRLVPAYAGLRKGAVVLRNSGGAAIATVYVYGSGLGPQVAFSPATQTIVAAGTTYTGVAVDAAGNVYVADPGKNRVLKATLSGGSYTESFIGVNLFDPRGLAIDGAGNLYIAETGNNRVLKETLSGGTYTQSVVASGLNGPIGVAVDSSGNVYIGEWHNARVLKLTYSTTGYSQSVVATGVTPSGVAVDSVGNVYIVDHGARVLEATPNGSGYTQSVIANQWSHGQSFHPLSIAVSGSGHLFIGNFDGRIYRLTPSGGSYTLSVAAEVAASDGIAVGGDGNVYIANGQIRKLNFVTAALNFAPTVVGATSLDSPKTVTAMNIGNADLRFVAPGVGFNPSISTNFALDGSTTCEQLSPGSPAFVVGAGGECDYSISFAPTVSGNLTGSLTMTDNAVPSMQSVLLTGIGLPPITLSPATLPDGTYGVPYAATVTAAGTVAPYTFAVSAGALPPGLALDSSGPLDGTATATGTYNFTVTATDSNGETGSRDYTITIGKATATVTLGSLSQTYTGSALSTTATTNPGGLAVTFNYTQGGVAVTPIATGSYSVTATIDDSNYQGTATGTLVIGKATATITLSGLNQTYTGSALAAIATTTPPGLTVTYDYTQGGVSVTPVAAGSYSVTATINDANYQGTASGTLVIGKATATISLGGLSQTYTGSALAANATTTPAGLTVALTYDGGATAPTDAGSYAVVATVNDSNYQGTASGTLVIAKATATIALGSLSQTYSGSPMSATATTTPAGLAVSFTYDGGATAPTNAGNYAVVATVNDNNYQGTVGGTLVIGKAAATITLGNLNQTYTGSALSPTATTNPAGLAVTYSYTQGGVAATPTGAGSYSVTATIDDNNYQGTATGTLVIGKATAAITLGSLSQTYTGSALSATALTNPAGLTVSYSYTQGGVSATPISAGSYSVTGVINDANYEGSATGTLIIGKATATIALGNLNQTYTGAPLAAAATTAPAGLPVDVTYDGGATVPTNAGNYAVVATVNDNNYQGTATGTLVIDKATATITLGSLSQTYNGSALSATALTNPAGLTVTYNYTQGGASVTPIAAGSYAVTGTIDDANYQGSATGTLVIGKATATVTLGSLSQTYTGSALAATAVTNPVGLTVDFTYNGGSTFPVDANNYSVLGTVSDLNYEGSANGTLVVGKASLSVTASDASMTYGAAVPTLTGALTGAAGSDGITASYTTTATSASSVGPYTITPVLNDPNLRLINYTITATDAVLTIGPATLTVVADDVSVTYNSAIPALTGTLSGVFNNDPITATWTTTAGQGSNAGTYPITGTVVATPAVFANYTISSTSGTLTITKAPGSAATLSTSATTGYHGQSLTFTAHVTNPAGTPDGSVAFYDGATLLGSVTLASGTAVYSTSALSVGTHSVTAVYAGSTNYVEATSSAVDQVVLAPAVSINGSGTGGLLGTITVNQGGSGTTQFQIGSLGTLTSAITVACSGLPAGLACQATPSTINVSGLPATVTVTVSTAKYKIIGSNLGDRGMAHLALAMGMLLPGVVLLSRKRRIRFVVLPLLSIVLMLGLNGCGGGTKMTNAGLVTPPGTYSATITAASSGATSITSTLNVVVR